MKTKLFGLLLAGALHLAAAAELSSTEQAIVATVKARQGAALALLEKSVNINSGTMNHEGVRAVGTLFRAELEAMGFATRWIDMPASMQRAGHLIATRTGKQGKRVLLIGHLDTVFEKDSPMQGWELQGNTARGQGVNDMKGGDIIILEALRALHSAGALENTNITVIFHGDEEESGLPHSISRGDIVAAAKQSDLALAYEGAVRRDGQDTGTVGRRAISSWKLDVKGKQGHSQGIFGAHAGFGAIYEAARILDSFRREIPEPDLTFSPGLILGGTEVTLDQVNARGTAFGKKNVVPNTLIVEGDMRFIDMAQRDRARAAMRAIVGQNLAGTSASIEFHDSFPPMAPTPGNLKLLAAFSQASEDAGLGPVPALPAGERGAGDIQFVAPYVDSLDGLGASGGGAHAPGETLDVSSLERGAIRSALMLYRLTR